MKRAIGILVFAAAILLPAETVDRTREPATAPVPDFKLPPISETRLSNGLRVVLVEDARFPLVTVRLNFEAGAKFDPADLPGLASNTAALLTEGTKNRSAKQIAEEMDGIGGRLTGSANADALTLSGNALSENLDRLLDVLSDVARNAAFPENEVQLRKRNAKQILASRRAQPYFQADEKLYQAVFGSHPYARYSATMESLDKLDREAFARFRDTHLAPNNATLILIGRLPGRAESLKAVTAYFGSWTRKDVPALSNAAVPAPRRQIILVDRPGSVQADIHAGRLAVVRSDPGYYPLMVGSIVLGGGASSRMFKVIREKEGYAYDAHTEYDTRRDAAIVKAVTQVRNEVLEPALKLLLEELGRLGKERVAAPELTSAKSLIGGSYLIRFETQEGLAANLVSMDTLGLPNSFLEKANENVRNVEPDQLQAAAKKYFRGDSTIVVVGDGAKIGDTLRKFGEVTITRAN